MRFSLSLPTDRVEAADEFISAEAVATMARAAEDAGFDAVFVTEHPAPDEEWLNSGGHHALDPFVALSFAAATTTRLRLQTNLCVVPYRNPFLLAKAVATLDALSGGRMIFGVGAGYQEGEFRALGADFEHRNDRFDEALEVMKEVWSGDVVRRSGRGFEARGNRALPRPTQRPHPPIWVGGNSRRALNRAVEHGDGWMPMPAPPHFAARVRSAPLQSLEDLTARLSEAHAHADATGRPRLRDVMFMPLVRQSYGMEGFSVDEFHAEVQRQERAGVTQMAVGFVPYGHGGADVVPTRGRFLELVEGFGEEIVGPFGSAPAGSKQI